MTTSTPVKQSNAKAWVATIGSLLIAQLPGILQLLGHLPPPYGVVFSAIGSILALAVGKGTHWVSNAPTGTVLVPTPVPDDGAATNPYK